MNKTVGITLTPELAGALLGIGRSTVYKWVDSGRLKSLDVWDVRSCLLDEYRKSLANVEQQVPVESSSYTSQQPPVTSQAIPAEWEGVKPKGSNSPEKAKVEQDAILEMLTSMPDTSHAYSDSPLMKRMNK